MTSFLHSWDVGLFVLINQKGQNYFFDWFMPFITDLKNFIYVFPLLAIWIVWKEKRGGVMTLVFLGLTLVITDQFSSHFLKEWVGRVRPCHVLEQVRRVATDCNTSYSFPSSHAVNIFAASHFLSHSLKRFAFVFYLVAALVAYSRVYIGIHYPLDNILGAGIGILGRRSWLIPGDFHQRTKLARGEIWVLVAQVKKSHLILHRTIESTPT